MIKLLSLNKPAFTFFEVIMAMGIVTLALTSVVGIQLRTMNRVHRDTARFSKTLLLKSKLYGLLLDQSVSKKRLNKKETIDGDKFQVQAKQLPKKSPLQALDYKLLMLTAKAEWKVDSSTDEATLVTFLYKPRERKEEK